MDARPDVLAETVRAKRVAIDNDLELLRVRLQKADPRRINVREWARTAQPALALLAGSGALWWWVRSRRSYATLEQLLVKELRDLYATEQAQIDALAWMAEKASNPDLQRAFEQHRFETEGHVERLQRVFRSVGSRPKAGDNGSVSTMIRDAGRLLRRRVDADVRDAWLIAAAQRVEHVEIASYGTARTFAATLGYTYAAQLLQQTLDEERAIDEKLTHLAEWFVNPHSMRSGRSA